MQKFKQTYQRDEPRRARALERLRLAHAAGDPPTDDLPTEADSVLHTEALFFGTGDDPQRQDDDV